MSVCKFIQNFSDIPKYFDNRNDMSTVIFLFPCKISNIVDVETCNSFDNLYGVICIGSKKFNPIAHNCFCSC